MADDFDIFGKDTEFEEIFRRNSGPENETTLQLLHRTYKGISHRIYKPERDDYTSQQLIPSTETSKFVIFESDITIQISGGYSSAVHACLWKNEHATEGCVCILYIHTNTRNLVDALEVMSLCDGTHLLAFDLPGHGKSEVDVMNTEVTMEAIDKAIDWMNATIGCSCDIVLWARGMSTAAAIEYCVILDVPAAEQSSIDEEDRSNGGTRAESGKSTPPSSPSPAPQARKNAALVRLLVLDTPYTSIRAMVDDAINVFREKGYYVPQFLVDMAGKVLRRTLTQRTHVDPYDVKPIDYAHLSETPCVIFAAMDDDYIHPSHALAFAAQWAGDCEVKMFHGRHFGNRPENVLAYVKDHVDQCVEDYQTHALGQDRSVQQTADDSNVLRLSSSQPPASPIATPPAREMAGVGNGNENENENGGRETVETLDPDWDMLDVDVPETEAAPAAGASVEGSVSCDGNVDFGAESSAGLGLGTLVEEFPRSGSAQSLTGLTLGLKMALSRSRSMGSFVTRGMR